MNSDATPHDARALFEHARRLFDNELPRPLWLAELFQVVGWLVNRCETFRPGCLPPANQDTAPTPPKHILAVLTHTVQASAPPDLDPAAAILDAIAIATERQAIVEFSLAGIPLRAAPTSSFIGLLDYWTRVHNELVRSRAVALAAVDAAAQRRARSWFRRLVEAIRRP